MRNYKLRNMEFYQDWLRAVLVRNKVNHKIIKDDAGNLFVNTDISGKKFHSHVLRAQCEKEESANKIGAHVISMEEYMRYTSGLKLEGDDESPYFAVFCKCDEYKRM